jgi:glycosyltransferase involved in cell wall biosynthesis
MTPLKINFIERRLTEFISLEKVFRDVDKGLDRKEFETSFQKLPFFNTAAGMIKNLLMFRACPADIFHVTGDCYYITLRLPGRKTVLTIHDLRFLHTRSGLRRWVLKKILLDWPVKRAARITAISEATKTEILEKTRCLPDRIHVIENPLSAGLADPDPIEFNRRLPNILQVGTSPNKNVANLISAIRGIKCRLTLIGRLDNETIALLSANQIDFENKYDLEESEIKCEYQKADLVVFCSTYEGFGLPIIEAQAMQKPVVTSNISPMSEVAGEGAVTVDPFDSKKMRDGIEKVIADPVLRETLRKKGLENIKRFDAKIIAAKYGRLYRELAAVK